MKKFICPVCGHIEEAEEMPAKCPLCGKPMQEMKEEGLNWAAEHVLGVAKGAREDIIEDLRANFNGECTEVGMYLAMARVAHREGYPEIGLYWEKPLSKRLNTPPNSPNCLAKYSPTAPPRT